jgi:predicted transport protein
MASEDDHLRRSSQSTRALFLRYKAAIRKFAGAESYPTEKKYIGFRVDNERFAAFHIRRNHFKIWLGIDAGSIDDPMRRTTETKRWHTVQKVTENDSFDYVLGLVRQAYIRKTDG